MSLWNRQVRRASAAWAAGLVRQHWDGTLPKTLAGGTVQVTHGYERLVLIGPERVHKLIYLPDPRSFEAYSAVIEKRFDITRRLWKARSYFLF